MVLRWTKAATKDLRRRIDSGEINPNIQTSAYLGDIVSGEKYPQYEAPPPNGRSTAIVRFRRLFRRIQLERELQGRRLAVRGRGEEGKSILVIIVLLNCTCAFTLIFNFIAQWRDTDGCSHHLPATDSIEVRLPETEDE